MKYKTKPSRITNAQIKREIAKNHGAPYHTICLFEANDGTRFFKPLRVGDTVKGAIQTELGYFLTARTV